MPWTNVTKPTDTNYTYVTFDGTRRYDDDLTYDDASIFYDGYDPNSYTAVAKPTDGNSVFVGMAFGLVIPLTYSRKISPQNWTIVGKPTS